MTQDDSVSTSPASWVPDDLEEWLWCPACQRDEATLHIKRYGNTWRFECEFGCPKDEVVVPLCRILEDMFYE